MSTPVPSSGTDSSRRSLFLSLRLWSALACILLAATVLLLPVPFGARAFILGVLLFSGVFLVVDAGGKGKTFAALTVALLGLYLLFTAQRGVMLIVSGNIAGTVLGVGLLLLPAVGAWALVREIIFGARIQKLADELAAAGKLPEDTLPRSPSGRVDKSAAAQEFEKFALAVEDAPDDCASWCNLSCMYDACGERKRARAAMRNAVSLHRGRPAKPMV